MAFTGKASYDGGTTLPENFEDVSDLVGIISPSETPFLDFLGDADRAANSTVHEWIEDALLPRTDALNGAVTNTSVTTFTVDNGSRFRIGDQIRMQGALEVAYVAGITTNNLGVVRGYGGSTKSTHADNTTVEIIAPSALEGDTAPEVRFQNRTRKVNYTQIFTETVEVSKTKLALNNIGVSNELDHQTMARLRELTRYLESAVINGRSAASTGMGSSTVRRTMNGLTAHLATHIYQANVTSPFNTLGVDLTEPILNLLFRMVWENSDAPIDFILCNGFQKRRINAFNAASLRTARSEDIAGSRVDIYESDFGVAKVVLSRWVPPDAIIVGASSHLDVLHLRSRSFAREPLGRTGDAVKYQITGEYTLELRNEAAFGMLYGLSTT